MQVTLYMGMSVDGFVARPDDGLDFLPAPPDSGDLSFSSFLETVDAIVMGRRTFEIVLRLGAEPWPYGRKPMTVLSRSLTRLPPGTPDSVRLAAGEPAELLRDLERGGVRHVYVDGAMTARSFLAQGLLTRIVVTTVPVLIGAGISPWGPLPRDVKLELLESRSHPSGMVQASYAVLPDPAAAAP